MRAAKQRRCIEAGSALLAVKLAEPERGHLRR
jgi:hypothetical protein